MEFKIKQRSVGGDHPVFIVAELSANHLQRFSLAVKTIKAIKKSGADAVKLQTYTPDTIAVNSNSKIFRIKKGSLWQGKSLYQLYQQAYTPWAWQPKLKKIAERLGLICFSSPFDKTAVDFLEKMNVPAYKVASFEINDIPLIEYIASKNRPVIISCGIADYADIKEAVAACRRMGNTKIALLGCSSIYPAPLEKVNLKLILRLQKDFKCVPGISDHTTGVSVAIAAAALGAKIIEKHFILDRRMKSPDAAFSLEPEEFKLMVRSVREVEKALGNGKYEAARQRLQQRKFARSLFVVKAMKKGEIFNEVNLRSVRPGCGLAPKYLKSVLGKAANKDIKKATPLSWGLIKPGRGTKRE